MQGMKFCFIDPHKGSEHYINMNLMYNIEQ
jgi:hypothetical protein